MIRGRDANELAQSIYTLALTQKGRRITLQVNPSQMTATVSDRAPATVPFLTAHGDSTNLAELIHSYHQWGQPVFIGIHWSDELFNFWVEADTQD